MIEPQRQQRFFAEGAEKKSPLRSSAKSSVSSAVKSVLLEEIR